MSKPEVVSSDGVARPKHVEITSTRELENAETFLKSRGAVGFPAAVEGDKHSCSLEKKGGGGTHGIGYLNSTVERVKIGGKRPSRIFDPVTCPDHPNSILEGEPSVSVEGRWLARVLHLTMHNGPIIGPGVPTVLLGPPTRTSYPRHALVKGPDGKLRVATLYSENITIGGYGDKDTLEKQFEAVKSIEEVKHHSGDGKKRLEELEKSGKHVTISEHAGEKGVPKDVISLKEFEETWLGVISIKVTVNLGKGFKRENPVKYVKEFEIKPSAEFSGKLTLREGGASASSGSAKAGIEAEIRNEYTARLPDSAGPFKLSAPTFEAKAAEKSDENEWTLVSVAFKIEATWDLKKWTVCGAEVGLAVGACGAFKIFEIKYNTEKREVGAGVGKIEVEFFGKGSVEKELDKYGGKLGGEVKVSATVSIQPDWIQIGKDLQPLLRGAGRLLTHPVTIALAVTAAMLFATHEWIYGEIRAMRSASDAYHKALNQYKTGLRRGLRGDNSGGAAFEAFGATDGFALREQFKTKWPQENAAEIQRYRNLRALDGASSAKVDLEIEEGWRADLESQIGKYEGEAEKALAPVRDKTFLKFVTENPNSFQCITLFISLGYNKIPWSKVPENVRQAFSKCPGYEKWIKKDEAEPPPSEEKPKEDDKPNPFAEREKVFEEVRLWQAKTKQTAHFWNSDKIGRADTINSEEANALDRQYEARTGSLPIGSPLSPSSD